MLMDACNMQFAMISAHHVLNTFIIHKSLLAGLVLWHSGLCKCLGCQSYLNAGSSPSSFGSHLALREWAKFLVPDIHVGDSDVVPGYRLWLGPIRDIVATEKWSSRREALCLSHSLYCFCFSNKLIKFPKSLLVLLCNPFLLHCAHIPKKQFHVAPA